MQVDEHTGHDGLRHADDEGGGAGVEQRRRAGGAGGALESLHREDEFVVVVQAHRCIARRHAACCSRPGRVEPVIAIRPMRLCPSSARCSIALDMPSD